MAKDKDKSKKTEPAQKPKSPSLGSGMAEKTKKSISSYYAKQKKALDEI